MTSKYEKTIQELVKNVATVVERTKNINEDVSEIRKHLATINGRCIEHAKGIQENKTRLKGFPFNIFSKKWFWILVVVVILALAGMEVDGIKALLASLAG